MVGFANRRLAGQSDRVFFVARLGRQVFRPTREE